MKREVLNRNLFETDIMTIWCGFFGRERGGGGGVGVLLRKKPICYPVSVSMLMKRGRNLVTWSWCRYFLAHKKHFFPKKLPKFDLRLMSLG